LRSLQEKNALENLLSRLSSLREKLAQKHGKHVPLALKVAPDLEDGEIQDIADAVKRHRVDAVIATNTSLSRQGVEHLRNSDEAGGLSGAPILARSTRVLEIFKGQLHNEAVLIGAGGVMSGADAAGKAAAGASLVQLYTGLVYRGPELVSECASAFRAK
jgi:dihydroorotate dehydrogenase